MAVKRYAKRVERSAIFIIKVVLFVCLFVLFFGFFAIDNPQIIAQSRTAAITMTTFAILGISMTALYGGFAVGKKKSKEIIPSLCIAVFITDVVTYFQLSIMNVNRFNQTSFNFTNFGILFLVFILQIVAIALFVYFGNFVFFKINPPENCVVICDDISQTAPLLTKIGRYKKQYNVTDIITYQNENLKERIRRCDSVFLYNVPNSHKNDIIDYAYKHFTNIYMASELADVVVNCAKSITVDDLAMLAARVDDLSFEQKFIKRAMDIFVSGVALLVLSPLMLIVAIAIKLDDGGPILFKQKRATLNARLFDVLKFRTMVVDADKIDGFHPATVGDDRITKAGRVLRKMRIDELPQLINILKGDMSLVGPRPERIEHVEMYTQELPEFSYRLRVKAGLTGLAQVVGKYNTAPKDKLILDLMYIEKYSIWQDIMLLFRTVSVFFKADSTEGFDDSSVQDFIKAQENEENK